MTPLQENTKVQQKTMSSLRKFLPFLSQERGNLLSSSIAIVLASGLNLLAPILIAHTIDTTFGTGNFSSILFMGFWIFLVYLGAFFASYIQTMIMGGVAQRILFRLRERIFNHLQELPLAFFHEQKTGDIISRINADTDKLNQFFSQGIMQFVGNAFMILGSALFMLGLQRQLGGAALLPAAGIMVITLFMGSITRKKNKENLASIGSLSGTIQEQFANFSVIAVFHRRDYLRETFKRATQATYKSAISAGMVTTFMTPLYTLAGNLAMLIILSYGTLLIARGNLTLGILVSFLTYANRFYDPLKQIAATWSSFQLALAAWDRIRDILEYTAPSPKTLHASPRAPEELLVFSDVSFGYTPEKEVLHHVNITLESGKTYALVGPTGGGKTTLASLMAKLFEPTQGSVLFLGKDLREYTDNERAHRIGFILQEPFLFTGTVHENLIYGNEELHNISEQDLEHILEEQHLKDLLRRFSEGLSTRVTSEGSSLSLGQRQLLAFMRAVLRKPDLLILDEATANIDTVTEQLLQETLEKLPKTTTKVIIAHRLHTIKNADEIFFINQGSVVQAGSFDHAVDLLMHGKRTS